ncbi:MAG: electron transfer flavoprotein subunit alpha/FixB family protein [Planctomycetota bacterium]|jgi:electron transfer flavoprotein alpha subunit
MSRVLVVAEHRQGSLREVGLEIVTAARGIPGAEVAAALVGTGTRPLAEELARYVPRVLSVEGPGLEQYTPGRWAAALAEIIAREGPAVVLLPHSYHGMDLAGRLAAALEKPLATDLTGLEIGDGGVRATRLVYGGRIQARLELCLDEPVLLSVRPTAYPAAEPLEAPGAIEEVAAAAPPDEADVVVAVGRGIGEEENLGMMEELADALGGVLACSRPIVDRGWLPRDRQVGTSGKSVRPKVYVACGISGAFQHVAGMKAAGRIIAINRDPHAPIFKVADYGIVGDLMGVVPALTEAARDRRG